MVSDCLVNRLRVCGSPPVVCCVDGGGVGHGHAKVVLRVSKNIVLS